MIGKKINQLATELAPESTDLTIIGDPTTGVSKKITLAQLGAIFSGAVSFYNDLASFPVSGDINVIYCAKDTQKLYLWSGSAYVEVFPSQALLDTYQLRSEKGNANGYASLDSGGKVPISQLPSSIMEYKGTWNAATNTPTLANGTGDTGDVYICNVAGTVNFGAGPITFAVGDYVIYSGTIWQRSSGAVGTVTSVAASITGDSVTISGSPVTTSGTLAFAFNGTTAQYIRGNGTLETFPSLTGFVPYTGATANVDLGTHTLLAAKGIFSSSGSGDTVGITHSSGSGIALNITKGGNGEGLYINKTSGSGNAATIIGTLNATSLVKSGGTSSQFLKADGSVDSSTYLTTSDASSLYLPLTGGTLTGLLSINSALRIKSGAANGVLLETYNTNQLVVRVTPSSTTYDSTLIFPSNSRNYTFPDASGTLALVGGSGVGTVTSVAALTIGTTGTDLSSTVANGTTTPVITLNVPTASATNRGALSSTDWTTFNNKQNALTNPITGISASGRVAYFNGDTSITGSSNFFWDSTNNRLGIGLNNPQRTLEIHNATADSQLRISGAAPSVSLGEAITGAIYQAKFGLITANGQYVTGGVAGDFVMISQTGATIFATSSTEKMRVQASGNVSIGNTNDTYKLDVTGTGRFTSAVRSNGIEITNTANADILDIFQSPSALNSFIDYPSGRSLILRNKGSLGNLTIASTGAATFNTTSNNGITITTNDVATLKMTSSAGTTKNWGFATTNLAASDFGIYQSNSAGGDPISAGSAKLYFNGTGAATFSSSLTIGNTFNINASAWLQFSGNNVLLADSGDTFLQASGTGSIIFRNNAAARIMTMTNGGNVGIGTNNPSATLHVIKDGAGNSNTNITGSQLILSRTTGAAENLAFRNTGVTNGISGTNYAAQIISDGNNVFEMYTTSTTAMVFGTNATEHMRITSAGNVGIGTPNPGTKLHITGTTEMRLNTTSTGSIIQFWKDSNASYASAIGNAIPSGSLTNDLIFSTYIDGSSWSERMRITSGGNVLVGKTSDDGSKFQVQGDIRVSGGGYIFQNQGSSGFFSWYGNAGTIYAYSSSVGNIATINGSTGAYTATSDINKKKDFELSNLGLDAVMGLKPTLYRMKSEYGTEKHLGFIAQEVKDFIPQAYVKNGEFIGLNEMPIIAALTRAVQEQQAQINELKSQLNK